MSTMEAKLLTRAAQTRQQDQAHTSWFALPLDLLDCSAGNSSAIAATHVWPT